MTVFNFDPIAEHARLQTKEGRLVHFLGMHAKAHLQGNLLNMHLQQRFLNPGKDNVEISYNCPLPWGAVLLGVDVLLNGQKLQGSVMPKAEARDRYETALEKGDSSILVSISPDGSLGMELGNLLASEECEIHLHYAQVLLPAQGSLRIMLPTTMAPRYGDAVQDGGFEPHLAPTVDALVQYSFSAEVWVEGELTAARISSPSHRLSTRMQDGNLVLSLSDSQWLDRDLIVLLDELPSSSMCSVAIDTTQPDESVVMACLNPSLPASAQPKAAPAIQVQFLVDCSGSMQGDSIQSASLALQQMLRELQPQDLFSLSKFGTNHAHCHARLVTVDAEQLAHAQQWAAELQADMGGTEMEEAIANTLQLPGPAQRDLLLITDGEIYAIDALIDAVAHKKQRIFVVGIGSSPAEQHLRRLAQASGGSCEFVAPGEAVQPAILRMFHRLRSPVLSQLQLRLPETVELIAIEQLPEFGFANEQLLTYLRIRGSWPCDARLQLHGRLDGQNAVQLLAECKPQTVQDSSNTVARMAAHALCSDLAQSNNSALSPHKQQRSKVRLTELATRYQLVTQYTHFVLVHERAAHEKPADMPSLVQVPQMLAAGWGGNGNVQAAAHSAHCIPSVWRTSKASAASQKLADMTGDVELPAFLRKSAEAIDFSEISEMRMSVRRIQPKASMSPEAFVQQLETQDCSQLQTIAALSSLGLPQEIALWLRDQILASHSESQIVQAFVQAMRWLANHQWQGLSGLKQQAHSRFVQALQSTGADAWPAALMSTAKA